MIQGCYSITSKHRCNKTKSLFCLHHYFFLSDPSPIIALATLVTHSLTNSCLVNLIDVTLACQDANSKLVEVVTVVDVDAEKRVDDSLVQIWKLTFGHKAIICSDRPKDRAQGLFKILR